MGRVLIACECSGRARNAFRTLGHDAYSCDLLPAEDGPTPFHLQQDVTSLLRERWDLVIAHPPCTYLSRAGARWLYPRAGILDPARFEKVKEAASFFNHCLTANAPFVAVENPTPLKAAGLPRPAFFVQPWEHGDPWTKKTLFWTKGLPPLLPTRPVSPIGPFLPSNTGHGARKGQRSSRGRAQNAKDASRTFPGIAGAMAEQWGAFIDSKDAPILEVANG